MLARVASRLLTLCGEYRKVTLYDTLATAQVRGHCGRAALPNVCITAP